MKEYKPTKSLWREKTELPERETLNGDIRADAVVIGGGLCGILTAYMLQERGVKTVVLEADRIGSGQSGNTTAKITILHGLKYAHVEKLFGEEGARQYASANQTAVRDYFELIKKLGISCGFEEKSSYLYSVNEENSLKEEFTALCRAGVDAHYTVDTALPFSVTGAVRVDGQAQFHPLRFLYGLSERVTVYEKTRVLSVKENEVRSEHGTVTADYVVFASHFPFVNFPGYYFARMHQSRSYVVALENAADVDGMYMSADKGGCAFRNVQQYLLLSGAGHRTGKNAEGGRYDYLLSRAKEWYPHANEVARWSAEDCMPIDAVPYIGPYSSSQPNWYVATGFGKWGMTSCMVSARLLADRITGQDNPNAEVFSPQRFKLPSTDDLFKEGGVSVSGLAKAWVVPPGISAPELERGHGGIVEYDGHKVGVYKDEDGKVYAVDARCPHLGCQLAWNPDEKSWDCPCHGSRFSYTGKLLDGPAQTGIAEPKRAALKS